MRYEYQTIGPTPAYNLEDEINSISIHWPLYRIAFIVPVTKSIHVNMSKSDAINSNGSLHIDHSFMIILEKKSTVQELVDIKQENT